MPRSGRILSSRFCGIACGLVLLSHFALEAGPANDQGSTRALERLIKDLDERSTAWRATVQLQAHGRTAIDLLLQLGGVVTGPHGDWTVRMLALAKFREPAIPRILDGAIAILGERDPRLRYTTELQALVVVLGSNGPPAVPALLEIARASQRVATFDALQQVIDLEPKSIIYGQNLGPWSVWRPADDRLEQLERQVVPRLPQVQEILERAIAEGKSDSSTPHRPAAYLLARWGTGPARNLGLDVLYNLATQEPFYNALDSIRLLHALRAPRTTQLIRRVAARVPDTSDLKGDYLLRMSITLYQLGDSKYADLIEWPLAKGPAHIRKEATEFVDFTRGFVAEQAALALLRIDTMPIWEANRLIDELGPRMDETSLPFVDMYLRRRDLRAHAIGPGTYHHSGGAGATGSHGPRVVTHLLAMVQRNVPDAAERLLLCLRPPIPACGSTERSHFPPMTDVARLNIWLGNCARRTQGFRKQTSSLLLQLGDSRGIPAFLDDLESDDEDVRKLTCRALRVYSQKVLPCDVTDAPLVPPGRAAAWRGWWRTNQPSFQVRAREAELDLAAFPTVTSVGFGGPPIQ